MTANQTGGLHAVFAPPPAGPCQVRIVLADEDTAAAALPSAANAAGVHAPSVYLAIDSTLKTYILTAKDNAGHTTESLQMLALRLFNGQSIVRMEARDGMPWEARRLQFASHRCKSGCGADLRFGVREGEAFGVRDGGRLSDTSGGTCLKCGHGAPTFDAPTTLRARNPEAMTRGSAKASSQVWRTKLATNPTRKS